MSRLPLVAVGLGCAAAVAGRRLGDLGARGDEGLRPLPGDELIPAASMCSTMAVTIAARPEDVYPWLVQMGHGRAGWYSFDLLDNGRVRSAERIEPAWQQLSVGDRMPATANGRAWFEVAVLEPPHVLVLRASLTVPAGRSFDPSARTPRWFSDSSWAFVLEPVGLERSRLLVRLRVTGAPRRAAEIGNALVLAPGHVLMQRRQLANIRRRAEAHPR